MNDASAAETHTHATLPNDDRPAITAPEALNREGAMALARRLQQYWHDRGYRAARFWAAPSTSVSRRSAPMRFIASSAIS